MREIPSVHFRTHNEGENRSQTITGDFPKTAVSDTAETTTSIVDITKVRPSC